MSDRNAHVSSVVAKVAAGAAIALMGFVLLVQCVDAGGVFGSREKARRADCLNRLKYLMLAAKQYSMDFEDVYPWNAGHVKPKNAWCDTGMLYPNYTTRFELLLCPSSMDQPFEPATAAGSKIDHPLDPLAPADTKEVISYAYSFDNTDKDARTAWTENAKPTLRVFTDRKAGSGLIDLSNHRREGRNAAYLDGHVKWKADAKALDPDAVDDDVGAPDELNYVDWWSDPPWYAEGLHHDEQIDRDAIDAEE